MKKFIPLLFLITVYFSCSTENEKKSDVTFNGDVSQIIHTNCSPCHHKGGAGPFSLMTYSEIKKKSKTIKKVVETRFMPPWPADVTYSHFAFEKVLSEAQIEIIKQWVDKGCPEGDSLKKPTLPVFNDFSFGKPDLVLKMEKPFLIKGENKDNFITMKFPFELPQDTFIRMIEFVPGNKKVVHHMNAHLVQYEYSKKKNVFDGQKMVDEKKFSNPLEMHKALMLTNDDGTYPLLTPSVCNYLPGVQSNIYPQGIGGYRVSKKSALYINNMHYAPTSKDVTDQSYFNIYFSPKPPERPMMEVILGTLGKAPVNPPLVIPANEVKKFTSQLVINQDLSLLTITPHMHLLGKSFLAYAIKPNGDSIPLIRINNWDFRWQYFYTFKKILKLPAGSLIYAEGVFDNTTANPNNPNNPPKEVRETWPSMGTKDEMFQFIINYVPYKEGDENISLEIKQ